MTVKKNMCCWKFFINDFAGCRVLPRTNCTQEEESLCIPTCHTKLPYGQTAATLSMHTCVQGYKGKGRKSTLKRRPSAAAGETKPVAKKLKKSTAKGGPLSHLVVCLSGTLSQSHTGEPVIIIRSTPKAPLSYSQRTPCF